MSASPHRPGRHQPPKYDHLTRKIESSKAVDEDQRQLEVKHVHPAGPTTVNAVSTVRALSLLQVAARSALRELDAVYVRHSFAHDTLGSGTIVRKLAENRQALAMSFEAGLPKRPSYTPSILHQESERVSPRQRHHHPKFKNKESLADNLMKKAVADAPVVD